MGRPRNRSLAHALLRRFLGPAAAHQQQRGNDPRLEARIQSFELAFRMQLEASDAFDISKCELFW